MNTKNKKTKNLPIFMFLLMAIFGILLFYIIGVLIQMDEKGRDGTLPNQDGLSESSEFASYFPGCGLINNSCLSSKCNQYFLCNDKKYLVCEIYDCGENFGVGTKDENGKIDIRRKIKDERKKIAEIKNRCDGTLKILKSDCVEEKLEIQTQVSTAGDCAIEGFMAVYKIGEEDASKKSFKPAKFSDLGDGLYSVKTSNCNEILELIAIGEAGVSIK